MTLPWVRLETGFPSNVKVLRLVDAGRHRAALVYVCSLAWCGAQETDGYVPRSALPYLHGTRKDAGHLLEVGLWQECGDGYLIPDWSQYQVTKEVSNARRAEARAMACRRWHPQPCARCNA